MERTARQDDNKSLKVVRSIAIKNQTTSSWT